MPYMRCKCLVPDGFKLIYLLKNNWHYVSGNEDIPTKIKSAFKHQNRVKNAIKYKFI